MSGKKFFVSFLVGITVLVLLVNMSPGFAGNAEAAVKRAVVTTDGINVRSGPGTGFKRIGMVNKGASYDIVEQKNGWAKLKISSNTLGWVKESYLKVNAKSSGSQPVNSGTSAKSGSDTGKAAESKTVKTIIVKTDNVNLRSGPGTKFASVGKANKGQQFVVIKESGGWYYANIGQGKFGWIIGQFVSVKASTIKASPDAGQSSAGNSNPNPVSAGNQADLANSTLVIKGSTVNIRSGAGTGFGIVSKVNAGDRLAVLKKDGQWYLVRLPGGKQGWVAGWLAELNTSVAQTNSNAGQNNAGNLKPNLPPGSNETVDLAKSTLVIKGSIVNIRKGASTGFGIVAKVKAGDRLTVLKRNGEWYFVQLTGSKQGWVAGWLAELETSAAMSRDGKDQSKPPVTQPATEPTTPPTTPVTPPTEPATPPETPPETGMSPGSGEGKETPIPIVKIQSIELTESNDVAGSNYAEAKLVIKSEGEIQFNVSLLNGPDRVVIDLQNSDVNNIKDFVPTSALVSNVRVAQYTLSPMVVRIVLDLNKIVSYTPKVDESGKELTLTLSEPSIKGKVIVIDAGHGGYDPGALGVTGLYEKDFNLDTSLKLQDKLTALGATVIMTRTDDSFISLSGRANVANQVYADIFVSVHANSTNSSALRGTSTYFYAPSTNPALYSQREQRQKLAARVQNRLVAELGTRNIGTLQANFAVLRETQMPSILVESAFLSNPDDEALLKDSQFRDKEAQAIADGLSDYFAN